MREIKFRAWDNNKKEMFEPNSTQDLAVDTEGITYLLDSEPYASQVAGYTIMQYTGLKDKNGVEIYEGDIVGVGDMFRQIVFVDGKFQLTGLEDVHNAFYDLQPTDELQIVGNTYENRLTQQSLDGGDKDE